MDNQGTASARPTDKVLLYSRAYSVGLPRNKRKGLFSFYIPVWRFIPCRAQQPSGPMSRAESFLDEVECGWAGEGWTSSVS